MRGSGRFGPSLASRNNTPPSTGGLGDVTPPTGGQTAFSDRGRRKPWKTPPELNALLVADVSRPMPDPFDSFKPCRDVV